MHDLKPPLNWFGTSANLGRSLKAGPSKMSHDRVRRSSSAIALTGSTKDAREFIDGVRLVEQGEAMARIISEDMAVTACQNNRQLRPARTHFSSQLDPVDARHDDVGEDDVDVSMIAFQDE